MWVLRPRTATSSVELAACCPAAGAETLRMPLLLAHYDDNKHKLVVQQVNSNLCVIGINNSLLSLQFPVNTGNPRADTRRDTVS